MARWIHCAACGRAFRSTGSLQAHVEQMHDHGRPAVAEYDPTRSLESHEPVKCFVCGLQFENEAARRRHDRWAHPDERLPTPTAPPAGPA